MKKLVLLILVCSIPHIAAAATAKTKKTALKPWRAVPMKELRITAERTTEEMQPQQVVIYGSGVAIWNNAKQIQLTEPQLKRIVAAFDAAKFDKIPANNEGEHLLRRASIRAGSYERELIETYEAHDERAAREAREESMKKRGGTPAREEEKEMDDSLEKLVNRIFAVVVPVAQKSGLTAESLTDGLKKIASGKLAPETLTVIALVKPELGRSESTNGYSLQVEGGTATLSRYDEKGGFSKPERTKVAAAKLRDFASRLLTFDPDDFPINLYGKDYEEVTVIVLGRRKNVLARQFAGLTPEKHGDAQKRFDAMMAWVDQTRGEWFAR